jgi:DNA polymerase I
MINAYTQGKDLYAVIASTMFDNKYEDNLEFYPEGTEIEFEGKKIICGNKTQLNKAGKERRFEAKSVLIGLLYGRGAASIAEQITEHRREEAEKLQKKIGGPLKFEPCTREHAQDITDKFFKEFTKVKAWIDQTQIDAHKNGYVEDFLGRRRRLPDIQLPKYEIKILGNNNNSTEFNPLLGCHDRPNDALNNLIANYQKKLERVRGKNDFNTIKMQALGDNLEIKDNTGFISQAERQSVNARVQGGAASLTKMAMINMFRDKQLNDLGFKLLITVHDEVMGECPAENATAVAKRLMSIMIDTAKPFINVPMKCDPYIVKSWYADEMAVALREDYEKYLDNNHTHDEAMQYMYKKYTEFDKNDLDQVILNGKDLFNY